MNWKQARKALFEGATVREKASGFLNGGARADFKIINGKIHCRFLNRASDWAVCEFFYRPSTRKSTFVKLVPKRKCEPAGKSKGLYSKFEVTKGGKPLDAGCFVLVPFNKDGSVNDANAVRALDKYRAFCDSTLATDIAEWINNPTSRNGMNAPKAVVEKYEPAGVAPRVGDKVVMLRDEDVVGTVTELKRFGSFDNPDNYSVYAGPISCDIGCFTGDIKSRGVIARILKRG